MLRLETFGGLRLTLDGREHVQPRMRLALLARLAAAAHQGLPRDEVLACLWPERDTDTARHSLDQLLYELRQSIRQSPVTGTATLLLAGDVESDLAEFESALRVGDFAKAVATYRGPFLQGFYLSRAPEFERWAESMRSELEGSYRRALESLTAEATAGGRHAEAVDCARTLVTTDPLSARATLALMRALVASGDRAGALDWARKYERLVRVELETDPNADVVDFVRVLRAGPEPTPVSSRTEPDSHDVVKAQRATPVRTPVALLSRLNSWRWRLTAAFAAAALPFLFVAALVKSRARERPLSSADGARSLSVVPFVNVGGDSAQAYLADGISDELATALGRIHGIQLVSRTAARQYQGRTDVDARQVGHALGADFVVQGTVRRSTDRLRVAVQLTATETGQEIWANTYERPAGDAFAVQDEIVRAVADTIRSRFGAKIGVQLPRIVQRKPDPEAYDLYLRGQSFLRRRTPGVGLAAAHFDSAIGRDSNFAPAYAGLSTALALFPYFANTPPDVVYSRAAEAAQRALALDSTLSEPHTALALAAMRVHAWARADSEHRKALAADPTDPSAHHQYGRYLFYTGEVDSALIEFRRAESIDPSSALYSSWVAHLLADEGKTQEAVMEFRRALDIDSLNPVALALGAQLYVTMADTSAARRMIERLPDTPPWTAIKVYVTGKTGNREAARRIAQARTSPARGAWFDETIKAYAALGIGDTARALSALERATDGHEMWMVYESAWDRLFDPVRTAPRFHVLLQRIGLTDHPLRRQ